MAPRLASACDDSELCWPDWLLGSCRPHHLQIRLPPEGLLVEEASCLLSSSTPSVEMTRLCGCKHGQKMWKTKPRRSNQTNKLEGRMHSSQLCDKGCPLPHSPSLGRHPDTSACAGCLQRRLRYSLLCIQGNLTFWNCSHLGQGDVEPRRSQHSQPRHGPLPIRPTCGRSLEQDSSILGTSSKEQSNLLPAQGDTRWQSLSPGCLGACGLFRRGPNSNCWRGWVKLSGALQASLQPAPRFVSGGSFGRCSLAGCTMTEWQHIGSARPLAKGRFQLFARAQEVVLRLWPHEQSSAISNQGRCAHACWSLVALRGRPTLLHNGSSLEGLLLPGLQTLGVGAAGNTQFR